MSLAPAPPAEHVVCLCFLCPCPLCPSRFCRRHWLEHWIRVCDSFNSYPLHLILRCLCLLCMPDVPVLAMPASAVSLTASVYKVPTPPVYLWPMPRLFTCVEGRPWLTYCLCSLLPAVLASLCPRTAHRSCAPLPFPRRALLYLVSIASNPASRLPAGSSLHPFDPTPIKG